MLGLRRHRGYGSHLPRSRGGEHRLTECRKPGTLRRTPAPGWVNYGGNESGRGPPAVTGEGTQSFQDWEGREGVATMRNDHVTLRSTAVFDLLAPRTPAVPVKVEL